MKVIGKILNLRDDWWESLEKLAKEKQTTVTAEIREAIRKHLEL